MGDLIFFNFFNFIKMSFYEYEPIKYFFIKKQNKYEEELKIYINKIIFHVYPEWIWKQTINIKQNNENCFKEIKKLMQHIEKEKFDTILENEIMNKAIKEGYKENDESKKYYIILFEKIIDFYINNEINEEYEPKTLEHAKLLLRKSIRQLNYYINNEDYTICVNNNKKYYSECLDNNIYTENNKLFKFIKRLKIFFIKFFSIKQENGLNNNFDQLLNFYIKQNKSYKENNEISNIFFKNWVLKNI